MTHKETLTLALEALTIADNIALVGAAYTPRSIDLGLQKISSAITAIKEALAQPEQEPVAWITQGGKGWLRWHKSYDDNKDSVPLYTTPPQRKPLATEHCTWKQHDDMHMPDTWESDCGAMWTFTEGGPKCNDMHYCPKCGKPAIEAKLRELNEEPHRKQLTDEQMQFLATAIGQAQQIIDTHNAEFVTARDDLRRCAELLAANGNE